MEVMLDIDTGIFTDGIFKGHVMWKEVSPNRVDIWVGDQVRHFELIQCIGMNAELKEV